MKRTIVFSLTFLLFLVPSVSSASTFTQPQINAIIGLLQAFNVDQSVIDSVLVKLTPTTLTITPQVQNQAAPIFGNTQPIQQDQSNQSVSPTQIQVPTPVVCTTTPIITITFDQPSVDIENNPTGYINQTTNVVDNCGREIPYNITQGTTPRRSGFSALGTTTMDVSINTIAYWELVNHPVNYNAGHEPYPVVVSTATASSTSYIQVL